jgi:hypothetical protein
MLRAVLERDTGGVLMPGVDLTGLISSLRRWRDNFEPVDPVYVARYVSDQGDGWHLVDVLRPDGSIGEQREVRGNVRAWPGLHVRLSYDRKRWGPDELVIVSSDSTGYGSSSAPSSLELHGADHGMGEIDQIPNLHSFQMWPLRVQPYSGMTVQILPGIFFAEGVYRELETAQTLDLTAHVPATAGWWRFVTISINASETINATDGDEGATLTGDDIPNPPAGYQALCAVRLHSADTTLSQDRFRMDLRYLGGGAATGAGIYSASQVGEVLFSTDGVALSSELPLTNDTGWMVNDEGTLLVVG